MKNLETAHGEVKSRLPGVLDQALGIVDRAELAERARVHYVRARSVVQAVEVLDTYREKARIVAGGVDIMRLMKNEILEPEVLVSLQNIPGLAHITAWPTTLSIGALTTISDLEASSVVQRKYPVLAEAARQVAYPQLRNMATVAGNLTQQVNCWYYRLSPVTGRSFICRRKGGTECFAEAGENRYHAIFGDGECRAVCGSDLAVVLTALGGEARVTGPAGERVIPVEDLYTSLGTALEPNEIVTEILVPAPEAGTRYRYIKHRVRKAVDPAILSVAAAITIEDGRVSPAGIVLGAVASGPYRCEEAEELLRGQAITEDLAREAARAAVSGAVPLSRNGYKVHLAEALVKRAVLSLRD